MIGSDNVYIDQGARRYVEFARATGVTYASAAMAVRGTNGLYRYDCTTSFTWPPD